MRQSLIIIVNYNNHDNDQDDIGTVLNNHNYNNHDNN